MREDMTNLQIYDKVKVVGGHYAEAVLRIGQIGIAVGRVPGNVSANDLIEVCFDENVAKSLQEFDETHGTADNSWNDCCFEGPEDKNYAYFFPSELKKA